MRRTLLLFLASVAACTEPAAPRCTAASGQPAVDALTVCTHLDALGCRHDDDPSLTDVEECAAHYASFAVKLDPADFARLTQCYAAATSCGVVAGCSVACPATAADAGP